MLAPPRTESGHQILTGSNEEGIGDLAISPGVEKTFIEASAPMDEHEQTTDLGEILAKLPDGTETDTSLSVMRQIPNVLRDESGRMTVTTFNNRITHVETGDTTEHMYGMAFDIGTTSIVGTLVDLTTGEELAAVGPPAAWQSTIRTLEAPLGPASSLVVLKGSLAPDGAVLKKASSSPHLHKHRGPAVVFDGPDDAARIDDPALGITPEHVLVMRYAGPVAMGMPEAGSMPLPKYLAEQGVKDMVRISDGRMSGTAYGTVVLHVAPEAAVGGESGRRH